MTKIVLRTPEGHRIPLKELEIREIDRETLNLRGVSEGGVGLLIGYYIKTEIA